MKRTLLTALAALAVTALSVGFAASPASASLPASDTALTITTSPVTFGQESQVTFSAKVTGSLLPPVGTVTVSVPGTTPTTLCTMSVTGTLGVSNGSCSMSSDTLLPASITPYDVTATYSGDADYSSSSDSGELTVDQATTTTGLVVAPSSVTYGNESTVQFTATVSSQSSGTPTGVVAVVADDSTPVCDITLSNGTGSCTGADDAVGASATPHAVTAEYQGDANFTGSTSDPSALTVAQASTTTSMMLSTSQLTFGDETTLQVTATVSPQFNGSPSGTIDVTAGATPLCSIVLPATSCSPTDDDLLSTAGSPYTVGASYEGDANFIGSPSTTAQLTVVAGDTSTSLTVSPSSVSYGNEQTVTFTSTVTSTGGAPTGTITIAAGPTTLCTIDAATATTCQTSATALDASATPYEIVASYAGDGGDTPSASDPMPLTVGQASTTTSLTLPTSSISYGDEGSITFSPTVAPAFAGTPTGSVTVSAGPTTLCSFDLASATGCSTSNTALPASVTPYQLTASYGGDPNFIGSASSPPQALTVTQDQTTTGLSLTSSSVVYGDEEATTFTATLTPQFAGSPTGTITVAAGGTTLCTITLPASPLTCVATSPTALDASGSAYSVTATYSGDANFAGSASGAHDLTVQQAGTTSGLLLSASSVAFGSESTVTFSATVTPQFTGTPTGTVTIATPTVTLCTITLPATSCTTTDEALVPAQAPYTVTASYAGDTNFKASVSAGQALTVTTTGTTTSLALSSSSASFGDEQSVTFTATVTNGGGSTPSGVVTVATVANPSSPLCTISLPTTTPTCTMGAAALGASGTPYQIVATYGGDTDNAGSASSPPQALTVTQDQTTTGLSLTSSSVVYGDEEATTFTATLTPQFAGSPTGTITVAAGGTTLCTITLPASPLTCVATSPTALDASGSAYSVTATYSGDANFAGSASGAHDLTVQQAGTTSGLLLSASSVAFGSESTVTFSATVTPQFTGTPTGTVTIATPTVTLCTITLPATSCTTTDEALVPAQAPYTVTASYAGDTNFIASISGTSDLTITGGTSSTILTIAPSSVVYGSETAVSFTITVTSLKSGDPTSPTGKVTVDNGSTHLCTATLGDDDAATCSLSSDIALGASTYSLTATYAGDTNFTPSLSPAQSLTVTKAGTGTGVTASPPSVTYGGEAAAVFTTSVTQSTVGTPGGTVTVAAGGTSLCTITLPATTCSAGQTPLNAGAYTLTATYSGNINFQSSSGSGGFTVNQATPSSPDISNLPSGAAEESGFTANVATNGDGATSVVSDSTSNCTVGSDGRTVSFLVEGPCTLTPQVTSGLNYTAATGTPQTFTILPGPRGYWLVGSDGGIFSFGSAHFYGSMGGIPLQRPVVGITPTHDKQGYWLVASDGGIFSFGDSNFYGSIPGLGIHPAGSGQRDSLDAPIVGMVPSSDGNGYFMVASDGGVFAFGDAKFAGSCPGIGGCAGSAVAVMPDHSGNGYWLVTSTGDIYAFGDAPFFGAPSPQGSPVVNAVATTDGRGYWILYANGNVLPFGDASSLGDPLGYVNSFNPATSIFPTSDGLGYWVASDKGDVFSYGNAPFLGSMSATPLNGPIIAAFGF